MNAGYRRAFLAITAIAFLLRIGWVGIHSWRGGADLVYDDEQLHWQLASNLVHRGELISDDGRYAARTPLYPLFLAIFANAGVSGIVAARIAQAALSAATVAIGMCLTRRAFDARAAVLAGLLLCFDPFAIYFSALLLNETAFATTLIALLTVCVLPSSLDWPRTLCIGALSAALVMIRPEAIGLLPLLAAALIQGMSRRNQTQVAPPLPSAKHGNTDAASIPRKRHPRPISAILVIAGVLCITLCAWGVRNRTVLGYWVFLSCNGGLTLYDGQGPQADGSSNQSFLREMPEIASLPEALRDQCLAALAREQMIRDPGRVAKLALVKIARTWSLTPNVEAHRGGATAIVSAIYMLGIYALLAAAILRQRARLLRLWPIWLPLAYSIIITAVYIGSVRYRVPFMPLVELLAAGAIAAPLRPMPRVPDRIQYHE